MNFTSIFGNRYVQGAIKGSSCVLNYFLKPAKAKYVSLEDEGTIEKAKSFGMNNQVPTQLALDVLGLVPNDTDIRVSNYNLSTFYVARLLHYQLVGLFNCQDENGHYFALATKDNRDIEDLIFEMAKARYTKH